MILDTAVSTQIGLMKDMFEVKCTGRGLVVKRPGIFGKVLGLDLVLGMGLFTFDSLFHEGYPS